MHVQKNDWLDKYLQPAYNIYLQCAQYKTCNRRFETIDSVLEQHLAPNQQFCVNDYLGFYTHFYEVRKAEIDKMKNQVSPRFRGYFTDQAFSELPSAFYYVLWLFKLYKGFLELYEQHREFFESAPKRAAFSDEEKALMKTYADMGLKWKLLMGLFHHNELGEFILQKFISSLEKVAPENIDEGLEELTDARSIKDRFFCALKDGQKIEVGKLLGLLLAHKSELDSGEYEYLEAVVRHRDGDYDGALRYVNKLSPNDTDYSAAISLKLECYADRGDGEAFVQCLEEQFGNGANRSTISVYYLDYLIANLFLNLPIGHSLLVSDDEENELMKRLSNAASRDIYTEEDDWGLIGQARRLVAKCVEELFLICEQDQLSESLYSDFDSTSRTEQRKKMLLLACKTLLPENVLSYLDDVINNTEHSDSSKDAVIKYILQSLIDQMPRIDPENDWMNCSCAFMFLYRLSCMEPFVESVIDNIEFFEKQRERPDAAIILQMAYLEALNINRQNDDLTRLVESYCPVSETTVKSSKIKSKLSPHGLKAYEFALWQFEKSCEEEDYGWKDAGLISLGFFRILEVEINERIIKPLVEAIDVTTLLNEFNNYYRQLSGQQVKNTYRNNWKTNLSLLQAAKANDPNYHGFELGKLNYLFKMVTTHYDSADPVATHLKTELNNICDFVAADIATIICQSNREKFRNPPAHTKYLPYKVAVECKDFVETALLDIYENLK